MSNLLPFDRLVETQYLLAFFHPKPAYPFHVLILPKTELTSMLTIKPEDAPFLVDCFATIQKLVECFNLEAFGYRVIINSGQNQEFPILHFHLISEQYPQAQEQA